MNVKRKGNIQLPHLETFSRAAELSSFTGTANSLGLTQAAVSQRIQVLEKILGKSLFERRSGRVLLTQAGRTLYAYVQRILNLHQEARREIMGPQPPVSGELLIGASSIPGEHLLPAFLAEFSTRYPNIRVRAAVSDSMVVMEQVGRGEVNIGMVGRKSDHSHLEFRYLTSDRMVLVAPIGHALSLKKRVTLRQIAAHPLILREAGSGLRHCFEKALEHEGDSLANFHVALELGSNEAIKQAVLRGVGLSVLSRYAVQEELKAGRLKAIEIQNLSCDRDMFVVQDRRRVLPFPARLFLGFLETHPVEDLAP